MASFEHFIAKRLMVSGSGSFTRTIIRIAIASLAMSMAIMLITNATITGFKYQIKEKIFGFWGHVQIQDVNINQSFDAVPVNLAEIPVDTLRDITEVTVTSFSVSDEEELLQSQGGIQSVNKMAVIPGVIDSKDYFDPILLKGLGDDYDWSVLRRFLTAGDIIAYPKDEPSDDIIISEQTAKKLKLELDQKFIIGFLKGKKLIKRRFRVKGLYRTGLEEYDQRFAIVDIREIQQIMGWSADEVSGLEIRLEHLEDMDIYQEYINVEMLPAHLESRSIRNTYPAIFDWLDLQDVNEDITIALVLLVALVNMITTLLILIIDRTRMIGVLKSLGANNWRLRRLFLHYAGYIVVWGLLIGNVLGISLCLIQKYFGIVKLDEESYYLTEAPIQFNLEYIFLLNVASAVIIILVLLIPSYLISRIEPVKAIGFD